MSEERLTRRDFLTLTWSALGVMAAAGAGYVGLQFLSSRVGEGAFGGVINAGLLEDFPPGTVTPVTGGQFFLIRREDEGLLALYRKCTHLDCVVLWSEQHRHFSCPCHGSEFTADGEVLNPPAALPLRRFPISMDNGEVLVDTGTLIERAMAHPEDVFYPALPTEGAAS